LLHSRPVLHLSDPSRMILLSLVLLAPVSTRASLGQLLTAEFALQRQQHPLAVHTYRDQAMQSQDAAVLDRALALALDQGDLADALLIANHWVEVQPDHIPALFYLAHLALRTHDYPLAAHTLDRILAHDPSAALDRILIGIYPENTADRQALLDALTALNTRGNPSLLVLHAGLLVQDNRLTEALVNVNAALVSRPDVTAFLTLKASILMQLQSPQQVQDWLQRQSTRLPKNKSLQLFEVRYLLNQHQQKTALARLDRMARRWPQDGEITLLAALVSIDQQRPLDAEKYLLQLLTQDEYIDQAYYYLGINAERLNRPDVAEVYLQKVQSDALYRNAQRKLVMLRMMHDRLSDALASLTQERVDHPDQSDFLYMLQAQLLRENGQNNRARQLLDEAIGVSPDQPELIYARLLLMQPKDDAALMEKELERLLILQPENPTYLNAYAYALADQNRRLDDAWVLAQRANTLSPQQPAILDTLGFIAMRQSKWAQAIPLLQQAYDVDHSMNIGLRLAQALQANQQFEAYRSLIADLQQRHTGDPRLPKLSTTPPDPIEPTRKAASRDHKTTPTVLRANTIGLMGMAYPSSSP
jgi:predicted Zn-dependent protease